MKFKPLGNSLSVVAHELGHAVQDYYSLTLDYNGQSGALNESISDIFGIQAEHYYHNMKAGDYDCDWSIGKGLFVNNPQGIFRSLSSPGVRNQPRHMNNFVITSDDSGGVHTNSGIPNYAFYLAAKGFQEESWKKAGNIWFKAMLNCQPNDDFRTFAERTLQAAKVYHPGCYQIVAKAWSDVGVIKAEPYSNWTKFVFTVIVGSVSTALYYY